MGKARAVASSGITLDAGALVALERGQGRMLALLMESVRQSRRFHVPAGVLGQTWRDGRRQAIIARFLRADEVTVVPLDAAMARAAGELCGHSGTSDVIDASVVITARQYGDSIVTSDVDDLQRLDSKARLVSI
jgi:predicted nucleic acid-binding protein